MAVSRKKTGVMDSVAQILSWVHPPQYLASIQNNDHSVIVHRFPLRLLAASLRARRAANCSSFLAQVKVCLHS